MNRLTWKGANTRVEKIEMSGLSDPAAGGSMGRFQPKKANEHYKSLARYTEQRTREISGMAQPYIQVTDRYGRLIARVTLLLGQIKPRSRQDVVIRDLMADVFDCLYEARVLILSGKCTVAFPVARRAYESLSLLHLCTLDNAWADRWERGVKISNGQVRKELSKHPMGESEEHMKDLYNFFCAATHPNRDLIPSRCLGEGNLFVLGVIGVPNLIMVLDYVMKHLDMWFWLTATVSYFYRIFIEQYDKSYFTAYMDTYEQAKVVSRQLEENFNRLLRKARAEEMERNVLEQQR